MTMLPRPSILPYADGDVIKFSASLDAGKLEPSTDYLVVFRGTGALRPRADRFPEPAGTPRPTARNAPGPDSPARVAAHPEARREFQLRSRQRRKAAFRRTTGLPLRTGYSVHPVPKRCGNSVTGSGAIAMAASAHLTSTAVAAASMTSTSDSGHRVPLFGMEGAAGTNFDCSGARNDSVTMEWNDDADSSMSPQLRQSPKSSVIGSTANSRSNQWSSPRLLVRASE